jgi:hypothetical protein
MVICMHGCSALRVGTLDVRLRWHIVYLRRYACCENDAGFFRSDGGLILYCNIHRLYAYHACVLLMGIYHRENIAATNPCMRQQDHESLRLIFNVSLGAAKRPEAFIELSSSAFTIYWCFIILDIKIEVLHKIDLH